MYIMLRRLICHLALPPYSRELSGSWSLTGGHPSKVLFSDGSIEQDSETQEAAKHELEDISKWLSCCNVLLLGLVCFLPFGGHFIKSSFSSLEVREKRMCHDSDEAAALAHGMVLVVILPPPSLA